MFHLITTELISISLVNANVEEFQVYGPMELHTEAMNEFLRMRKENPSDKLEYDGPFLTKAKEHAIKRLTLKPDHEVLLHTSLAISETGESSAAANSIKGLQLPAPDTKDSYLSSAINTQQQHITQSITLEEAGALALAFHEEVGLGQYSIAHDTVNHLNTSLSCHVMSCHVRGNIKSRSIADGIEWRMAIIC